jgi:hypothetical protein
MLSQSSMTEDREGLRKDYCCASQAMNPLCDREDGMYLSREVEVRSNKNAKC